MSPAETEKERTDRQLIELLTELRVALPGAQVLLGFLLTVPFATRFNRVTESERVTLYICLLLTVAGTLLLMAPSVYHRLRWEHGGKSDVVHVAHRLFLAGSAFLGLGIVAAIYLVGEVMFGVTTAAISAFAIGAGVVSIWYVLPATRGSSPEIREQE